MLRSFAIAIGTVVALASVQPADAAGSRQEARSAGKAARPAAAPTRAARPAASQGAAAAPRRQRAADAAPTRRQVFAVRGTGRAQALRYADRRPAALGNGRTGLRFVSLFSAAPAAAATLPARGGKYGKATYTSGRNEGADEGRSSGRMGVWHAGLPAADGEQMDCPAGTMAVLASGHVDTFRCMPM